MSRKPFIGALVSLFLLLGVADLSAQTFFPAQTKGTHQVRFTSNVAGVQVAIDGESAGVAPLTVWVRPGVHAFSFTAPGQAAKTIPYQVKADTEVPFLVSIQSFPLTVNTNVPGASLAIDGKAFASTGSVTVGSHTLTVSAPGYQMITVPFQQPASANVLNLTLVANTFVLTVNTNVPNASLAIDGAPFAGNTTNIMAGAHTLSVSAPGYQTMSIPFQQPASPNTLNVTLVSSTFPLTVRTNVPNASLAVDGVPFAGGATSVSSGAHTLTVSAPGYQTMSIPFQQPASQNTLNVTLMASTYPLTVKTNVPEASLAMDGVPFAGGATSVSAGAHTLTVSAPGYQTMTIPFQQPASQNTLNVTLMASTYPLTVKTNVPEASLAMDGVPFVGSATAVTAGSHTLTVSAPGYQTMTIPFQQPASANSLNVTLIALTGTVTLNTEHLFRPGTPFTVFVNNAESRGSVLTLPAGTYQIRLVSGPFSVETTVTVAASQSVTLDPSVVWQVR